MKKRAFSMFIAVVLCFVGLNICMAEETTEIYINDTFEERADNSIIEDYGNNGGSVSVVRLSDTNKAALVDVSDKNIKLEKSFTSDADKIAVSLEIAYEGGGFKGSMGLSEKTYSPTLIFDNGYIKSHDGKIIGNLSGSIMKKITVYYDLKNNRYSVTLGGREILCEWAGSGIKNPTGVKIELSKSSEESGNIYLDSICVYKGEKELTNAPKSAMSQEEIDNIPIENDVGDYCYLNSIYCNTRYTKYENTTAYPKTNKITMTRFDYKNKNRTSYILFEKTDSANDCYIDVGIKKLQYYNSQRTYRYFKISADVKLETLGSGAQLFTLKDTTSSSVQQVLWGLGVIESDGSLTLADGSKISGVFLPDKWATVTISLNLDTNTYNLYLKKSGEDTLELAKENIPFNNKIKNLDIVRISYNKGIGKLYVDNWEITGLIQPYETGIKTSIFPETTGEKNYLADKISFHSYGQLMYKDGVKTPLSEKPVYSDDLYITPEDASKAFDTEITCNCQGIFVNGEKVITDKEAVQSNGKKLIPIKEIAQNVLGMYCIDDGEGMVIFSDNKINLDLSNEKPFYLKPVGNGDSTVVYPTTVESLNRFLFFERPSAEEIKEKFMENTDNGTAHPRIQAKKSDFERIKEQKETDPVLNQIVNKLMEKADLAAAEVRQYDYVYADSMRTFNVGYQLVLRMQYLGFGYQMTGDQKYIDRAWRHLELLSTFPDFNTSHCIDTGMYVLACAIGYDWMYDGFSAEQRKIIEDTAINFGIDPLGSAYYGRLTSTAGGGVQVSGTQPKWTSNYNTVINGGLLAGAVAFADVIPDRAFDYIEKGLRAIEASMYGYECDGGWVEGPDYWYYATRYLVHGIGAVESSCGTDFGIMKYQGLEKTCDYMISQVSLKGRNNYHDADESSIYTWFPYSFFAKQYDKQYYRDIRIFDITENNSQTTAYADGAHVYDAIYYSSGYDKSSLDKLPTLAITRGAESFGIHGSYTDDSKLYVAAHFGATEAYHSHNDTGAFVLDLIGERWAIDLGKEDYNLTNTTFQYRRRAEGHNTLVIQNVSGYEQLSGKFSPIIASEQNDRGAYVIADCSDIYAGMSSYKRGFYAGDDMTSVTVRDEFTVTAPQTVYWSMHTRAQIEKTGENELTLTQNGKSVTLKFETNAESAVIEGTDAKPLPGSPTVTGQNANTGIYKALITLKASGDTYLTVKIAPKGEYADDTPIYSAPLSEWSVPEGEAVQAANNDFSFKYYIEGEESKELYIPRIRGNALNTELVPNNPENIVVTEENGGNSRIYKIYDSERKYYRMIEIPYSDNGAALLKYFDEIHIESIEVSDQPEPDNPGINAIDGDLSTRWHTPRLNEWAVLDLGELYDIDAVAISSYLGNARKYNYEIQTSEDGINYRTVIQYSGSGTTEAPELGIFDRVRARYIKYIAHGNNLNNYSNVTEFKILHAGD